jgi:hypothetical protein
MSHKLSYAAVLLVVGGAAMSIAAAPIAAASGADSVIADLQAQGDDVQINWVNGFDTEPLSICTVTNVNNPDHSGGASKAGATVYVDVSCPNHDYD